MPGIALHAFFGIDDIARAGGHYSATRYKAASGNSEKNIGTIINHKPQKLSASIGGHVVTIQGFSIASSVSNGIATSSLSAGFNRIHRQTDIAEHNLILSLSMNLRGGSELERYRTRCGIFLSIMVQTITQIGRRMDEWAFAKKARFGYEAQPNSLQRALMISLALASVADAADHDLR
ncbi:hypothetical protein BDR06DRAFT_973317 [Suillus hirtellus]|nr:hypothetical protein BDR06DRAFT_973317 [Suillus hirtellus]